MSYISNNSILRFVSNVWVVWVVALAVCLMAFCGGLVAEAQVAVPSTPDLKPASDSGTNNDNTTNDSTPTFSVGGVTNGNSILMKAIAAPGTAGSAVLLHDVAVSGASQDVTFSGNNCATGTIASDGSTVNLSPTTYNQSCTLSDGLWNISVQQLSSSGFSDFSSSLAVTIDTVAPTVSLSPSTQNVNAGASATVTATFGGSTDGDLLDSSFVVGDITLNPNTKGSATVGTRSGATVPITFTANSNAAAGNVTLSLATGVLSDLAGNTNTQTPSVTIAIVTKTATPTISAPVANAYVNTSNESLFTISGTSANNAAISISVDDTDGTTTAVTGSVTANGSGAWVKILDLSSLNDDTLTISVTATEGTKQASTAATRTVTKDTSAPTPSLSNAPSGTNNTTTLDVTVGGAGVTHYKYDVVAAANCNIITLSGEVAVATKLTESISSLADGTITLCYQGRDLAGNWSTTQNASWTKDTAVPTLTGSTVTLTGEQTVSSVKYLNATDTIAVALTFSDDFGATQPTVQFKNNTTNLGTAVTATGTGNTRTATYTVGSSDTVSSGNLKWEITNESSLTDSAGNAFAAHTAQTIASTVIDTTAPTISSSSLTYTGEQTVSSVNYLNATDTAAVAIVFSENISTQPTVQFKNDTTNLSTAVTATGSGTTRTATYMVGSGDNVSDGDFKWDITNESSITDNAGNALAAQAAAAVSSLVIDTTVPVALVLDLSDSSDSCVDVDADGTCEYGTKTDDKTNDSTPTFTITGLETNGTRDALVATKGDFTSSSTSLTASDILAAQNASSATITATQAQGDWTFSITQTDRAGNTSPAGTITVTFDNVSPAAPSIDLVDSSDSGDSTDHLTNDNTPTFEVIAPSNDFWSIGKIGSALVDSDGSGLTSNKASYTTTAQSDGRYTLAGALYDEFGNISADVTQDIRIDTSVAEATFTLDTGSDSGVDNDRITNVDTPKLTFSGLESSADPLAGTGKADVVVSVWTPSAVNDTTIEDSELAAIHTFTDVTAASLSCTFDSSDTTTTQCTGSNPFTTDGVYRIHTKQTDDAGNVTSTPYAKFSYNTGTGVKGDNVLVIDTTAPAAPATPDLKPTDDSFGGNPNHSRTGTDNDDITNDVTHTYYVDASARAVGDGADLTGAALTREQHHMMLSVFTTTHNVSGGASQTYPDPASDTLSAVGTHPSVTSGTRNIDTAARFGNTGSSVTTQRTGMESVEHSFASAVSAGQDKYVYLVARQRDLAGNVSAYSSVKRVQIDRQNPLAPVSDVELHPARDTGSENNDKQTSSTTPVFRSPFVGGQRALSISPDLDYFEVRVAELDAMFETTTGYLYRSSTSTAQQGSYNYLAGDTDADITALVAGGGYTGNYPDGITVVIDSMNIPSYNTWYAFKIYAVDLAGNVQDGVDNNNVRILVPPPTPRALDLASADDTCVDHDADGTCDVGTSVDNLTKNTTFTLNGAFGNGLTSTGQNATEERTNDAAGGVGSVVVNVTPPSGSGAAPTTVTRTVDRVNSAVSQVVVPGSANGTYTYATPIDLTSLYPSLTSYDGDWIFTSYAVSASGEGGGTSGSLTVTVDTIAPTPQHVQATVNSFIILSNSAPYPYPAHIFFMSDDSVTAGNSVKVYNDETGSDFQFVSTGFANVRNRTGMLNGTHNGATATPVYREDFSYYISYLDEAGNESTRAPLPNSAKAPRLTGYLKSGSRSNGSSSTHVITAMFAGGSSQGVSVSYTPSYNFCHTDTANFAVASGPTSGVTTNSYTLISDITTTDERSCVYVSDNQGNGAILKYKLNSGDLVGGFKLGTADESDDSGTGSAQLNDKITNNTTPRLYATTLPNSTNVKFQYKASSATEWTDIDTTYDATTGILQTAPLPTLADGTYDVQAITRVPGASSDSTVDLGDVVIDTVDPNVSSSPALNATTDSCLDDNDSDGTCEVGSTTDGITKNTTVVVKAEFEDRTNNTETIVVRKDGFSLTGTVADTTSSSTEREASFDLTTAADADGTVIESADVEGVWTMEVVETDVAGNVQTRTATFTVDTTPPTATLIRVPTSNTRTYNSVVYPIFHYILVATDEVSGSTLAYYVHEHAATVNGESISDSIKLGGQFIDNRAYTAGTLFTGTVQDPQTDYFDLAGGVVDEAGNEVLVEGSDPASVNNDSIQGAGNVQITNGYKDGTTLITKSGSRTVTGVSAGGAKVLFKIDDAATDPATYTAANRQDTGFASFTVDLPSGQTNFSVNHSLSASDNGKNLNAWIWTDSTDASTQTPAITVGVLQIDDSAPSISNVGATSSNTDTARAKNLDIVTVIFKATEQLHPSVLQTGITFAGENPGSACTPTGPDAEGAYLYSCRVLLTNDADEEDNAAIRFTVRDLAGNALTYSALSGINVDASAPSASYTVSSENLLVAPGTVVPVGVVITDRSGIATSGSITAATSDGTKQIDLGTGPDRNTVSASISITAPSAQGPATIDLPQLADAAGNTHDAPVENIFFVDTTAPSITDVSVVGGKKRATFTVTVDHSNPSSFMIGGAPVEESVRFQLSGPCASFGSGSGSVSDGSSTGEVHTFTLKASRGTYEANSCTIKVTDDAGNESAATTIASGIVVKGSGGGGGVGRSTISTLSSLFTFEPTSTPPAEETQTPALPDSDQQQLRQSIIQRIADLRARIAQLLNPDESSGSGTESTTAPSQQQQQQQLSSTPLPTSTYGVGDRSEFIRKAQEFLNEKTDCKVAAVGAGSPGYETDYFGSRTQQAVTCYQRAQGLTVTGTLTVETYKSLVGYTQQSGGQQAQQVQPTISLPTRTYRVGDRSEFVRKAQAALNKTDCSVDVSGPGSAGLETDYFGGKTKLALECYQLIEGLPVTGELTVETYKKLIDYRADTQGAAPTSLPQTQTQTQTQTQPRTQTQTQAPTLPVQTQQAPPTQSQQQDDDVQYNTMIPRRATFQIQPSL